MEEKTQNKFLTLNVNEHTEEKNGLTYLSWAWAWQKVLENCPDASYEIKQFADKDGVLHCYQYDSNLGYMVFTSVTINGLTKEMWLPVMDGANKAMKAEAYTYTVGKGERAYEKSVEPATMFDVNKTIMRCLTKNLAMFGLGLYIYAGEDLPAEEKASAEQIARIRELNTNEANVCARYKVSKIEDLTISQAEAVIKIKTGGTNK